MRVLKMFLVAALVALFCAAPSGAFETDVYVSTTPHKATHIEVNVSGTWHDGQSVWTKVSGTWVQNFAAFTPYTDTIYAAASPLNTFTTGNLVVPAGASHVVITLQGAGGPGTDTGFSQGGSGGGMAVYSINLTSADWGKNIAYSLMNRTYQGGFTYQHSEASCSFANGAMALAGHPGGRGYDAPTYQGGIATGGNVSNVTGGYGSGTQGGTAGDGTAGATTGQGAPGAGGGPQTSSGYGGEAYLKADWS